MKSLKKQDIKNNEVKTPKRKKKTKTFNLILQMHR